MDASGGPGGGNRAARGRCARRRPPTRPRSRHSRPPTPRGTDGGAAIIVREQLGEDGADLAGLGEEARAALVGDVPGPDVGGRDHGKTRGHRLGIGDAEPLVGRREAEDPGPPVLATSASSLSRPSATHRAGRSAGASCVTMRSSASGTPGSTSRDEGVREHRAPLATAPGADEQHGGSLRLRRPGPRSGPVSTPFGTTVETQGIQRRVRGDTSTVRSATTLAIISVKPEHQHPEPLLDAPDAQRLLEARPVHRPDVHGRPPPPHPVVVAVRVDHVEPGEVAARAVREANRNVRSDPVSGHGTVLVPCAGHRRAGAEHRRRRVPGRPARSPWRGPGSRRPSCCRSAGSTRSSRSGAAMPGTVGSRPSCGPCASPAVIAWAGSRGARRARDKAFVGVDGSRHVSARTRSAPESPGRRPRRDGRGVLQGTCAMVDGSIGIDEGGRHGAGG